MQASPSSRVVRLNSCVSIAEFLTCILKKFAMVFLLRKINICELKTYMMWRVFSLSCVQCSNLCFKAVSWHLIGRRDHPWLDHPLQLGHPRWEDSVAWSELKRIDLRRLFIVWCARFGVVDHWGCQMGCDFYAEGVGMWRRGLLLFVFFCVQKLRTTTKTFLTLSMMTKNSVSSRQRLPLTPLRHTSQSVGLLGGYNLQLGLIVGYKLQIGLTVVLRFVVIFNGGVTVWV